jgi:hypothetical protein
MGKPNRPGRHAKQKLRKMVRRRGPDPDSRDARWLSAGVDTPDAGRQASGPAGRTPPARPQVPSGPAQAASAPESVWAGPAQAANAPESVWAGPAQAAAARAASVPAQASAEAWAVRVPAQASSAEAQSVRVLAQAAAEAQVAAAQAQVARAANPQADDPGDDAVSGEARSEQLVSDALQAQVDGQHEAFVRCAAQLADRRGGRAWVRAVERELLASLIRSITAGWRQNWQPAEVVREIGRQFGARHARLATDAIAMEMRNYARTAVDERWQAQLDALGATAWWGPDDGYLDQWREREQLTPAVAVTCGLEVLFGLATLPRLGRLCPLPGTARQGATTSERAAGRPIGHRVLGRVRVLLAGAESAGSPDEAEALTTRAQELLAVHSLDDVLMAAGDGPTGRAVAAGRRLFVDSPYEVAKTDLLDAVATANRCRVVWHKSLGLSTVLGFPGDLDAVELLFSSLLVQASTAMVQAGPPHDQAGPARTRSLRQSFLVSYAQRIGERLAEAAGAAERQAVADSTDAGLLPVLTARQRVIDEAVGKMFPDLSRHGHGSGPDRPPWLPGLPGLAAASAAAVRGSREVA